jgi:hypothetical protein
LSFTQAAEELSLVDFHVKLTRDFH